MDRLDRSALEKTTIEKWKQIPQGNSQYQLEFIKNYGVLLLEEADGLVSVGITESKNLSDVFGKLKVFHKKPIQFFLLDRSEFTAFLGQGITNNDNFSAVVSDDDSGKLQLDKLANDAPIINLVNSILIQAIRRKASDIHIEKYAATIRVRFRVDGDLHTERGLSLEQFFGVSSRIKVMANLNIMESRLPQDGRFTVSVLDDDVDVRVSIVPIIAGESIVLRLFNSSNSLLSLHEMGFSAMKGI